MAFKTVCPKCGKKDQLFVSSGVFYAQGLFLAEDGFAFSDAKQVDTEDEWVECGACGAGFSSQEVTDND